MPAFFGRLSLGIVEISRDGDYGRVHFLTEIGFGILFEFAQHHGRDLFGRIIFVFDGDATAAVRGFFYSVGDAFELFRDLVIATSDEAFYRIDGVLGVDHSLSSSQKTDQTLVGFIERHYRRCRPTAFGVRNHGRPSAFHDRHNRVRCSKVYSYSFPHLKSPR